MSDIVERLRQIRGRVGHMCSHHHPPRMSIPADDNDDDIFIASAADDATAEILSLRERLAAAEQERDEAVRLMKIAAENNYTADCELEEAESAVARLTGALEHIERAASVDPTHMLLIPIVLVAREALAAPPIQETKP